MKNKNWFEIIYEIYDFLFWEPQHIGKIKNGKSNIKTHSDFKKHIENIEVSLNQILNIFFYFLPKQNFNNFLEYTLNSKIKTENYNFYLEDISNYIDGISNFTQPDFFFSGEEQNIAIEIKIKSKSSLEQVMKYLFLHLKEVEFIKKEKEFILIFIGEKDFKNLWKEKFETTQELKDNFLKYEIGDNIKKGNSDLIKYKDEIKHLIKNTKIGYTNYILLKNFCEEELKNNKDNEILDKLLNGLILELNKRKLQ